MFYQLYRFKGTDKYIAIPSMSIVERKKADDFMSTYFKDEDYYYFGCDDEWDIQWRRGGHISDVKIIKYRWYIYTGPYIHEPHAVDFKTEEEAIADGLAHGYTIEQIGTGWCEENDGYVTTIRIPIETIWDES